MHDQKFINVQFNTKKGQDNEMGSQGDVWQLSDSQLTAIPPLHLNACHTADVCMCVF